MKRSREKEMMDLPGNPVDLLEGDLRNLTRINLYLGNYRGVRWGLQRLVGKPKMDRFSLLDVGTGSGDIPVTIARWARSQRITTRIVGLERDPVTLEVARRQTRPFPEISIIRGDAADPPFADASFDFILSSQLLHHFSEEEIVALIRRWSKVARRAIVVSDLIRHPLAYYGIRLLTRLLTQNVMTRTDAPLSVRRAFTFAEWRELFSLAVSRHFELFSFFPFRFLALIPAEDRS